MNSAEIKKVLQNTGKVSMDLPNNEDTSVHFNLGYSKNGKVKVNAYLINNVPRYRISEVKGANASSDNLDTLDFTLRNVQNKLVSRYKKRESNRNENKKNGKIVSKLRSCADIYDNGIYNAVLPKKRHWRKSTTESSVDFLLNSVAPELDLILSQKGTIEEDDVNCTLKKLSEHAYKSGRGKKHADGSVSEKKFAQSSTNTTRRFERASIVYNVMREKHPEIDLPEIPFPAFQFYKVIRIEHPKAFPYAIRITIAHLLIRLCAMGLPYAFSGWLEFGHGLRAAEAIAPLFCEMDVGIGNYFVDTQVKKGTRTPVLKNKYAKRYIYFTEITKKIIELSYNRFSKAGFSDAEIQEAFFSANVLSPKTPLDESKHSAFLLDIFKLAGCNDDFIEVMQQELYSEIDRTNGDADDDLSAHMARRDWVSRIANGGIHPVDLDAEIGHENDLVVKNDYATVDTTKRRARENECAFVFDPDKTAHPYYRPIELNRSKKIHISGLNGCSFFAEQDCKVLLDISTLEPNNGLQIIVDDTAELEEVKERTPTDKAKERNSRLLLGELQDTEELRKIIEKADQIDIAPIFEKYNGG